MKLRCSCSPPSPSFCFPACPSGVWGTYNGIYTRQQLDHLCKDLTNVEEQQDRLFAVSNAHNNAIIQLDTAVSPSSMRQITNPSSITDVTLQRLMDMSDRNVGKAQRAIQAAQMRCLSVDFLNVDQLHDLHTQCLATAKMYDSKLIIGYPLHFFQVELSYIYSKDDVLPPSLMITHSFRKSWTCKHHLKVFSVSLM